MHPNVHCSTIYNSQDMSVLMDSVVSNSVTPWTVACQVLSSMGFSRQEYWSGLPFPPPGDLPNAGMEPDVSNTRHLLCLLHWQACSFISWATRDAKTWKQPKCPETGMDKENVMHIHGRILVITKNKIMPFTVTWMDPKTVTLSKESQTHIL